MTAGRGAFIRWLRAQARRDDRVGDLARDQRHDSCWPSAATLPNTWSTSPSATTAATTPSKHSNGPGRSGGRWALEQADELRGGLEMPFPTRPAIPDAEWRIRITIDPGDGPAEDVGVLRYVDSWAARNPNELGRCIARYIHEAATRRRRP